MTLGEQIWADAVKETGILMEATSESIPNLGRVIIAAIDQAFIELRRDVEAELRAMEDFYTRD